MSKKVLYTERLTLRQFEEKDKADVFTLLFDEKIKKTYMIPDFNSEQEAEPLFKRIVENSKSDEHFEYAICLNNKAIGFINDCSIKDGEIEIGYVINANYHGQGYMSEALKVAIEELFRIGYKRVVAGYFVENIASRRVMEKCGMFPLKKEEDVVYKGVERHCKFCAIENKEN